MNPTSRVEPLVFPGNMFQTSDNKGLSKREHFAVLILAGLCSNSKIVVTPGQFGNIVAHSVEFADRLIEKLAEADREGE